MSVTLQSNPWTGVQQLRSFTHLSTYQHFFLPDRVNVLTFVNTSLCLIDADIKVKDLAFVISLCLCVTLSNSTVRWVFENAIIFGITGLLYRNTPF